MNRTLPCGDCRRGSPDPRRPSGLAGAVPGAGGLVGGVAVDQEGNGDGTWPACRPGIATGAPHFAHVRAKRGAWRYWPTRAPEAKTPAAAGTGRAEGRGPDATWN